jgi:hypothetical protein
MIRVGKATTNQIIQMAKKICHSLPSRRSLVKEL